MKPLLRAVNLSKTFGTLPAVQQVSLEVYPGEVVGLAGASGSGKSALFMLLAGLYVPTGGDIYFEGRRLQCPFRARALGIEIIHQTPDLAERLDVTSNIFLGNEIGWPLVSKWLKVPNRRRMDKEAARILAQLDVHFDSLHEKVTNLSSEQRQLIAIARAMIRPAKLIIIDDPTLLLSYSFQQKLLSLIQAWQSQGTAVIFSSNNLDHLLAVTDRIIVLRQGRQIAEYRTDEAGREEIVAAMVGTTDRQQLTPIIWALDSYYRAREQAEKLRQSQLLLERDLASQDTLKRQLIDRLAEQINALDSANAALQDAQRRLLTELEQERKHLAREIHDQVIQDLLSVNYRLEELETGEVVTPALGAELADIRNTIRVLVDDLRHICGNLRPPTIDSLGLGAALQSYTHDWANRTGISVTLDLDANLGRLPEAIELSIFRIVQEGLSNVRKHARASTVQIGLRHTSPRTLMISIADDGQGLPDGFDLSTLSAKGHYGLLGISERVALLGGRLKLQNQAGGGLLIQAEIQHPRVAQSGGG
ncbi:MAG: ATP-binding cassette domain-containing protein [Anaerolineae bacterium]|jgi:signal transduction histidine kinase|nr:ATP-binding cassette domain-containing protein [Anaerolineae bacterium]